MPLTDVTYRSGFAVHAEELIGRGEVETEGTPAAAERSAALRPHGSAPPEGSFRNTGPGQRVEAADQDANITGREMADTRGCPRPPRRRGSPSPRGFREQERGFKPES
jgi:hypothetical protein